MMKKLSLNINILTKLKKIFSPFYKSKDIKKLFELLEKDETKNTNVAMFVGGCVRKFLSNEKIDDIDLACSLTPDQIKEKLKNSVFKVIDTGIEHGSITIVLDKSKFEITTLRKDIKSDGRHAEISYTNNWEEDSKRRDFTINAIYLDRKGKIFDPQNGRIDLKEKNLKFIGNTSKRIQEDYLRIIRFIRFSIQYDSIYSDPKVIESIKLNLSGLKNLSKERIFNELSKILCLKNIAILLKNIELKNIFSVIFPELKYLNRLDKLKSLTESRLLSQNLEIILSILLIDETDNFEYFCHKYKTSNKLKNYLSLIARNYKEFNKERNFVKKYLKKNIYLLGKDNIKNLVNFIYCVDSKFSLKILEEIINNIDKVRIPDFPFNGQFLKNQGVIDGKKIGSVLKELEKEWLENNFFLDNNKASFIINRAKI